MTNARQNKNQITKLSMNGSCAEDPDEIEQASIQHFTTLYYFPPSTSRSVEGLEWSRLLSAQANSLERRFEVEEKHNAIMEMDDEKAPDPDGFTIAFFKNYWEVVKNDLIRVLSKFFER